jgi:hypothetical protein
MTKTHKVIPIAGQRIFVLPETPTKPLGVMFTINTINYTNGIDFTVTDNMVIWADREFSLDPSDTVKIYY